MRIAENQCQNQPKHAHHQHAGKDAMKSCNPRAPGRGTPARTPNAVRRSLTIASACAGRRYRKLLVNLIQGELRWATLGLLSPQAAPRLRDPQLAHDLLEVLVKPAPAVTMSQMQRRRVAARKNTVGQTLMPSRNAIGWPSSVSTWATNDHSAA